MLVAAGLAAAAEVWRHHSISGGSRAAGVLPPRAATVVTKTPAATAMVGALPIIINQLKSSSRNGDGNNDNNDT